PPRGALDLAAADKMSDCTHAFLPRPLWVQVWRHLAVFTAFGKGFHAQRICENATLAAFQDIRPMSYGITGQLCQCRAVIAALLVADFLAARFAAARPTTASRPAPRISSENSPLPATRASTIVPIMVAIVAIACLRAALRGRSRICAA